MPNDIEDLPGACSRSSDAQCEPSTCNGCRRRDKVHGQLSDKPRNPNLTTPQSTSMKPESELFDVLIVGAGVIGCSVARELSRFELRVAVVEKFDDVSQGASKANSGIIHGGYDAKHGTLKSQLSFKGNQLFPQLEEELHFGFKPIGSLVLAFTTADLRALDELMENGRKNGVQNLKLIDAAEIRAIEPNVSLAARRALYCPDAGIASPYEYTIALAENAAQNGVQFLLGRAVTAIVPLQRIDDDVGPSTGVSTSDSRGGSESQEDVEEKEVGRVDGARFRVETSHGPLFSRCVINCAGLFADEVSARASAEEFVITPRKGDYVILDRSQGSLAKHVLFQAPTKKWGKGILVTPTVAGNLMLGPSAIDVTDKHDVSTSVEELAYVAWSARRTVPNLDLGSAITSFAGLRAKPIGKDFLINESTLVPGFINVAGIESPGLTSSPAIAQLVRGIVARVFAGQGRPMHRNPAFDPHRKPIAVPKSSSFDGEIDYEGDPSKNIICRCESVTEAEIRDALTRGIRLTSTDSVKWRTRAGMGPCQGSFCRPRVERLMKRVAEENKWPVRPISKQVLGWQDGMLKRDRLAKSLLARL